MFWRAATGRTEHSKLSQSPASTGSWKLNVGKTSKLCSCARPAPPPPHPPTHSHSHSDSLTDSHSRSLTHSLSLSLSLSFSLSLFLSLASFLLISGSDSDEMINYNRPQGWFAWRPSGVSRSTCRTCTHPQRQGFCCCLFCFWSHFLEYAALK